MKVGDGSRVTLFWRILGTSRPNFVVLAPLLNSKTELRLILEITKAATVKNNRSYAEIQA